MALALRFKCPIVTNQEVMDAAGIVIDDSDIVEAEDDDNEGGNPRGEVTLKQLQDQLDEAVENEDFEKAVLIRDAIFEIKRVETEYKTTKE